jgi:hypothetical protein
MKSSSLRYDGGGPLADSSDAGYGLADRLVFGRYVDHRAALWMAASDRPIAVGPAGETLGDARPSVDGHRDLVGRRVFLVICAARATCAARAICAAQAICVAREVGIGATLGDEPHRLASASIGCRHRCHYHFRYHRHYRVGLRTSKVR